MAKGSKKETKTIVGKVRPPKMKEIEAGGGNCATADENAPKAAMAVPASNIIGTEYYERSEKEGIPVTDISMTVWERNNLGKNIVVDEKDIPMVEENRKQLIDLHQVIQGHLYISLQKAIQAGELLMKQKELIRHGGFGRWIEDNMPIKVRTAQKYMRLYHFSHTLADKKIKTIADADAAINGEPAPDEVIDVDDSINVNQYTVENSVCIEDMTEPVLPRKKAQGKMTKMVIDQELVQQLRSDQSTYVDQKNKYVKIVVQIPSPKQQDQKLIGEFTCAAAALLKAGGKLIYHKKK